MPKDFRYSEFLRNEEKEKFIGSEEKVQERLNEIKITNIELKNRNGVILVKITKPDGEVIEDILRKDNIDYNYCVGLIRKALEIDNG